MSEATQYLVAPGEPDESVTNGFTNPLDVFNYVSPSAWVNDLIETTTGIDIFGYATDALTGEWVALYKFGDAMASLAQTMQQIGIDIQSGVIKVDQTWDGNASDAAYNYFSTLAATVSGQQAALNAATKGYHDAARGAWQLSNQLGNLLQAIADEAIIMGIAAAAGTVTAETGVGAVAGYGVAAYQAIQIIKLVNKASQIINTAGTVILAAFGGGMAFAGQGGDLSAVPLPATPYSAPKANP
ncbi:hypothetical protein ACFQFC_15820 [Amorphoplanes digitatis]|uniref:Uncharacterized protein YukE n=1 Tax=Actinoplanes digitatis TaxID=1868 RepID=A0A7W7MSU9_9ACTN|nr:hypothetical protein [Actinoplanes digitatis]MBB4765681.1 uncharacterized protein YukE [Actinoplanes digitatis]GID98017.1 hypothetical protein Adi01nite_74290 [Actinoplanes digitatis]